MSRRIARQFHNQPAQSHQHGFLTDLWDQVRRESGGRLDVAVHPHNGGVAGSDPRVLDMLVAGELEFATIMGPLLGARVPAAEIQGVPFAFDSPQQAHAAVDGTLGEYIRREARNQRIYLLPGGALENGFRQICTVDKPIVRLDDLQGLCIRVPSGAILRELFVEFGAMPVTINIDRLYGALERREVDGHENPLAITEVNGLYRVTRHIALSNHVWSGFNLIANLAYWESLPPDLQDIIHRAVKIHVARQRTHVLALNRGLERSLQERGMEVRAIDTGPMRQRLEGGFYARWSKHFGSSAWRLLAEAGAGTLRQEA